jgi:hypothetical protein
MVRDGRGALAGSTQPVTLKVAAWPPPKAQREYRMTSRASVLIAALAAGTLTAASLPAQAAMPVGTPQAANSDLTLVQDQTATQPKKSKKKSAKKSETDQSIESGTVPKRYKSSVPKEYHHLIPFAK